MFVYFFVIFTIANSFACSIQTVVKQTSVENLLHNKKDNTLYNELYGLRQDRFLRNEDLNKDELKEDQDNTDVYKGMMFAKLGEDTLNFHHGVKDLEKQLQDFRKHTELKLIPSSLLSASNNVYISNSKFLNDQQILKRKKRERLLEGQDRSQYIQKALKKKRSRELRLLIDNEQNLNKQKKLQSQMSLESLDFNIEDIYNISKEDMNNFTKGLLKK